MRGMTWREGGRRARVSLAVSRAVITLTVIVARIPVAVSHLDHARLSPRRARPSGQFQTAHFCACDVGLATGTVGTSRCQMAMVFISKNEFPTKGIMSRGSSKNSAWQAPVPSKGG
jgi:hypothetical protein